MAPNAEIVSFTEKNLSELKTREKKTHLETITPIPDARGSETQAQPWVGSSQPRFGIGWTSVACEVGRLDRLTQ